MWWLRPPTRSSRHSPRAPQRSSSTLKMVATPSSCRGSSTRSASPGRPGAASREHAPRPPRRARRRVQTEEDVPDPVGVEETSAEEQALDSLGQAGMLELIDRLSAEQRQVLTLKFLFGFANAEVATVLGKSEGAVKSLQHRALAS